MSKLSQALRFAIGRGDTETKETGSSVIVYDGKRSGITNLGDAVIKGTEVVIFNPTIILDHDSKTPAGVSAQLVGEYLAATVASFAEQDLGPMNVSWTRREGRFCIADITVQSWGETIKLVQPVQSISLDLAKVWKVYIGAMSLKIREAHKENQNFTEANRLLKIALRDLEALRNHQQMQFSRAEYLFLASCIQRAMVQSVVVGQHDHLPESVMA